MYIEDPNPFVFRIGGFGVRWYGLLLAISIGVGVWYILSESNRRGWDEDAMLTAILSGLLAGIAGARAIFVLTNWSVYSQIPAEIIRIDRGGLSWHGALLGGIIAAWIYLRRKSFNFGAVLDTSVPGLSLGYTLVRIANIFNQEVLGRYSELLGTRHPAQIYGSLIGLLLLLRYFWLQRRDIDLPHGYQFWSYFWWYSILRAVVEETVRANPLYLVQYIDEYWGIGFFTLTHLLTPAMLLVTWYFLDLIRHDSPGLDRQGG